MLDFAVENARRQQRARRQHKASQNETSAPLFIRKRTMTEARLRDDRLSGALEELVFLKFQLGCEASRHT